MFFNTLHDQPIEIYLVGGAVRDKFIGRCRKDTDYAVEAPSYGMMREYLATLGEIILEKPEFFTIKVRIGRQVNDYVLCRRDGMYKDGRHPESVELGSIYDDLARRDFTINAMAISTSTGQLIDPHDGIQDMRKGILRCVGDPYTRFSEDALRILRAIRFKITLGFVFDPRLSTCFLNPILLKLLQNVNQDRIREELTKCFMHDTPATLDILAQFKLVQNACFSNSAMWLKPTTEGKERD